MVKSEETQQVCLSLEPTSEAEDMELASLQYLQEVIAQREGLPGVCSMPGHGILPKKQPQPKKLKPWAPTTEFLKHVNKEVEPIRKLKAGIPSRSPWNPLIFDESPEELLVCPLEDLPAYLDELVGKNALEGMERETFLVWAFTILVLLPKTFEQANLKTLKNQVTCQATPEEDYHVKVILTLISQFAE